MPDAFDQPLQGRTLVLASASLLNNTPSGSSAHLRYAVRLVRAGTLRAAGNRPAALSLPAPVLQLALERGLFQACAVFMDHAPAGQNASLRNLVGVVEEAHWNAETQSVDGLLCLYATPAGQAAALLLSEICAAPQQPDVGISLVLWAQVDDGNITHLQHIESADLVFAPAADGRILAKLPTPQELSTYSQKRNLPMTSERTLTEPISLAAPTQSAPPNQSTTSEMSAWLSSAAQASAHLLIQEAGLPAAAQERLLAHTYSHPAQVQEAIQAEKTYLASLVEQDVIQQHGQAPRSPHIQMGRSGYDQVQLAFQSLLDGTRPPEGIRPLSGIREFYNLLSGDYELTGRFHAERVQFANVNSSSMSALVADALNKRVVSQFTQYPQWWKPVVIEEDFASLQQTQWVSVAGIGALPTVAEGAAYSELNWDDRSESADFIKKGGYLGITLEAIDKDDTRRLRAAPQVLAQAAYLTLAKSISDVFTANSGSGATLSDGLPLFSSEHANLGSSALSSSAWAATRQQMRDQAEFVASGGSAAALGMLTAPKFILVPNELENTALEILGGYSGGSASYIDTNLWAEGDTHSARMHSAHSRVVVVDLWSQATHWVAVCNPLLYPTLGIGYRYGRSPEVFSAANPTSGLMFTNDVLPVKVRFFFAVGALDWRGMYKHIV